MSVSRVDKPWGYELRFVRTDRYAGKVLFIKAGSLELVLGRGDEQTVVRMGPGDSRHITPGTVHRFRAVTDTLLFEVSTPELEDVVRIEDDYGREGVKDVL